MPKDAEIWQEVNQTPPNRNTKDCLVEGHL